MDADALRARWRALHPAARWLAAYAGALALATSVGALTPLGLGNALFAGGALLMLASLLFIRTGGHRKTVVHRDLQGRRLFTEKQVVPEREGQIRRGVGVFLLGVGLWVWLPVAASFGW